MDAEIKTRFDRLERTNKRLWLALGASLTAVVALAASPQAKPPKEIRAQSFVVVDEKGRKHAELATGNRVTYLMFERPGANKISMGVLADGTAVISAHSKDDKAGLSLGIDADGTPVMETIVNGHTRALTP